MKLEACLPVGLRGSSTTITKIAAGVSGGGIYRVEADGQAFVLKISSEDEPLAGWRSKLHIQQLAANACLAPRVIHVDEALRAVMSAFVVDYQTQQHIIDNEAIISGDIQEILYVW